MSVAAATSSFPYFVMSGCLTENSTMSVSVASLSPQVHFGRLLSAVLESQGITVSSHARLTSASGSQCDFHKDWNLFHIWHSQPIPSLFNHTLQYSDNLYAELLLRHLGCEIDSENSPDTLSAGLMVVNRTLQDIFGISPTGFLQFDGSGLSRHNLLSPETLVSVLEFISKLPNATLFEAFLPVGGRSGTLADRFINTTAEGRVHAKTGTEGGVNALSGYIYPLSFPKVTFSIINNLSTRTATQTRAWIDEIVVLLSELSTKHCP